VLPALRHRLRNPEFLTASSVLIAFAMLLIASWQRWLSPLTDSGREMDLPYRLLHGELLYRDVNYLYGPLSPYLNAALYGVFGPSLAVLQASGIAGALLVIWLSFRVARRLLEPREAALATLTIVVWLVFRPQGNIISPYAYAALHATIFGLTALLLSLRYHETQRDTLLLLASVVSGLAAVSKLEFALPALAAILACIYLNRSTGHIAKRLTLALAPFIALTTSIYGWFLFKVGWQTLVVDCHVFYTHLPQSLITYNAWRAGTNRPLASILEMFGGLAVFILIAAVILTVAALLTRPALRSVKNSRVAIVQSLGVLVLATLAAFAIARVTEALDGGGWDGSPLRAAPILLIALFWHTWRRNESTERRAAILIVTTFSLVMLLRVALRVPSGGPYGAFLLPTTYILFVYVLVSLVPKDLRSRSSAFGKAAGCILLGAVIAGAFVTVVRYRTRFTNEVTSSRGHFYVVSNHHPAIQEALDFLREKSSPSDRIAVFPEGSDIAFLSDRQMPLRHQILLPGLVSDGDERKMTEQLETIPVRFVFIVNRSTSEFGASVFGRDFYQRLGSAIERDYHLVKVCGKSRVPEIEIGDPEFFIKVFERN
jgi:hypothetical protein